MDHDAKKLEIFKETILSEAQSESAAIAAQAKVEWDRAVAEAESHIKDETQRYEYSQKAAIAARESKRVAAHRGEVRHNQFRFREDCAAEVYDMVRSKLNSFTQSGDYAEHLAVMLLRAREHVGNDSDICVYLRSEDMQLCDFLREKIPGAFAKFAEGTFELGGFQMACPSRGIRVDMSFDSALSDIIGHFSDLSGMHMD